MFGFITGAGSGIGYATSQRLLAQGWSLGLCDLHSESLQSLKEAYCQQVRIYVFDVIDAAAYQQALTDYMRHSQGQLHLLFNCAGILSIGGFCEIDAARYKSIVDVNVQGVLNGCMLAYPYLRQTKGAQVISMSSASAIYGVPHLAVYSATKFAVRGLTEALNIEWKKEGIHVGDIMPSFVDTSMLQQQSESAPVLKAMGVQLNADHVAKSVMRQLQRPLVHRSVGFQQTVLYYLSQLLPSMINRKIMELLARESS